MGFLPFFFRLKDGNDISKTSIVEALQDREDVFFYVVANDLFQEMVGERYLRADYWKYLSEVILMMYHTAKLFSPNFMN